MLRFISNCRNRCSHNESLYLTTDELRNSERYWALFTQEQAFQKEMEILREENSLPPSSRLFTLHPFIDSFGLLRVGGRGRNTDMEPSVVHPIILPVKHPITSLIVSSQHHRLMHAGPILLTASLNHRYHIIGCRKIVRSIMRSCITCRRTTVKPNPQVLGQLPPERLTPDSVFSRVGVDYAGPFTVKYGPTRKPKLVKTYVCVFVSLTIKAVHLELVSDLTTDAFIATLRRFIARRGKPTLIWSDHGTNFVGAARELKDFIAFFQNQKTQGFLSEFCAAQGITWKFIPERTPHFGGLWEAAVRSMKTHLRRIMGEIKFTFEEFSTILAQIEACLNSRPLTPIPNEGDVVEALKPGHFLIGRPLEALPDPSASYQSISLLHRWHLCQHVIRHFWKRWSSEYINILRRFTKWHQPSRNLQIGDVVILHEDNLIPTKWPMGRVVKTYPGKDGFVRIFDVKTSNGVYKRPITKIALLLPQGN